MHMGPGMTVTECKIYLGSLCKFRICHLEIEYKHRTQVLGRRSMVKMIYIYTLPRR